MDASSAEATGMPVRVSARRLTAWRTNFLRRLRVMSRSPVVIVEPACSLTGHAVRCHICRHLRIGGQHGTQRGLQRLEPGLVVPPVVHALAENGLADLLGARGTHGPLIVVEPEASLFDRQPGGGGSAQG